MPRLHTVLLCAACLLAIPAALRGELVLLTSGDVIKVSRFEMGAEEARLTLPSGGRLTIGAHRVDRVLEDEIVEPDEETPVLAAGAVRLTFDPSDSTPETPFGAEIYEASRRHGVNPAVLAAMARVESAFDPRAVSHAGARGLMQLMPATAERFGVRVDELFDPVRNLEASASYVAWLTDRFQGDPVRVVAAYNAGEGAVDRYDGVPRYRETQRYVEKVMGLLGASASEPPASPAARARTARLASR